MLQLLGTQDAFADNTIGKTMRKLTPKLAAQAETSRAPGWAWLCALTRSSLRELRLQVPLDFLAGLYPQQPSPLSLLGTQSYPCIILQQWFVQWTVSKKDVLTQAANILPPWSAFPHCFTANGVSSPGPTPAQGWGTATVSMLKEKWKIRSMSSGRARMMALQRERVLHRQNWHPT